MWKWLGRISYFFIIAFLSLQVYSFGYFSQLNAYYTDEVKPHLDNPILILEGMNTLLGLSYFQEEPFYDVTYNQEGIAFDLGIYAVGAVTDETPVFGYAIVLSNVSITHEDVLLERAILKLTVEMNEKTFLVNGNYESRKTITFDPGNPFNFQNVPLFFVFDFDGYNLSPDILEPALISRIELSYGYIKDDAYAFDERLLFLASSTPTSEAARFKDQSFVMNLSDYQLELEFDTLTPTLTNISEFGLNITRGDISSYQSIMIRYIIIFLVVIFVVTYALFFHKPLMKYKASKKNAIKTLPQTSIFKDSE
jgi:hypothetical protein